VTWVVHFTSAPSQNEWAPRGRDVHHAAPATALIRSRSRWCAMRNNVTKIPHQAQDSRSYQDGLPANAGIAATGKSARRRTQEKCHPADKAEDGNAPNPPTHRSNPHHRWLRCSGRLGCLDLAHRRAPAIASPCLCHPSACPGERGDERAPARTADARTGRCRPRRGDPHCQALRGVGNRLGTCINPRCGRA
jgi:hypothetical protein